MSLRSISLTLYQRLAAAAGNSNKTTMVTSSSVSSTVRISNEDENNDEENTPIRKEGGEDPNKDLPSERVLLEFMRLAGEPITYIEARELWNDMRSTNNGSLPRFQDMMMDSSMHSLRRLSTSKSLVGDTGHSLNSPSHHTSAAADDDALNSDSILQENETQPRIDQGIMETLLHMTGSVRNLSDEELSLFCEDLASQIKAAYSIRHSSDRSEFKFCVGSLVFLWSVSLATIAASFFFPTHAALGKFSSALLVESFSLFAIELVWECILSWVVLKYNLKINYTRKLGNLVKVPKYFIGDFFPAYTSSAVSLTFALALNQTLFTLMFYRRSRERFAVCAYVFLSQDRREDRPDTLIFQVTEDIMRFAVYFPFKLLVVNAVGSKALIFIPIAVNNIGDGLAEPVGVYWGRHKYSTTALYHKGKFFKESCAHVLMCEEEDRVKCFQMSADNLQSWLQSVGTCEVLEKYIMSFVRARNGKSFMDCIASDHDPILRKLARSQDKIGWRRFMEGMISKEFCAIQETHRRLEGSYLSGAKWAQSFSIKLMEMTHGQWLVRNFLIHDKISGMLALERKEELQIAIEEQQEMGLEGLGEEDKYLMEINLDDLETTSGEHQAYWLLSVKAAREAFLIRRQRAQAALRRGQNNHG